MAGIQPLEEGPGFKKFKIAPTPNYQIQWVKASLDSASGRIESGWEINGRELEIRAQIPFDTRATILLPDANLGAMQAELQALPGITAARQKGKDVELEAEPGNYTFHYEPTSPYRKVYSIDSPMEELLANEKTRQILEEDYFPYRRKLPFQKELYTFEELLNGPFTNLDYESQKAIDARLRSVD